MPVPACVLASSPDFFGRFPAASLLSFITTVGAIIIVIITSFIVTYCHYYLSLLLFYSFLLVACLCIAAIHLVSFYFRAFLLYQIFNDSLSPSVISALPISTFLPLSSSVQQPCHHPWSRSSFSAVVLECAILLDEIMHEKDNEKPKNEKVMCFSRGVILRAYSGGPQKPKKKKQKEKWRAK